MTYLYLGNIHLNVSHLELVVMLIQNFQVKLWNFQNKKWNILVYCFTENYENTNGLSNYCFWNKNFVSPHPSATKKNSLS